MQSTLGATLLISVERIAATALGALAGAFLATWFPENLFCLRGRGICAGTFVRCISHGENCVSLREHHLWNHRSHSAFERRMYRCASSLLRCLSGNSRLPGTRRRLSGSSCRILLTKRHICSTRS